MICIPIRYPDSDKEKVKGEGGGEKQWVVVELQGTLHNIDGGPLNSRDLGTIEWINVLDRMYAYFVGEACTNDWKSFV